MYIKLCLATYFDVDGLAGLAPLSCPPPSEVCAKYNFSDGYFYICSQSMYDKEPLQLRERKKNLLEIAFLSMSQCNLPASVGKWNCVYA